MENIQVCAGHLGVFTNTLTTICETFLWKYQLASLIWGIGHLLSKCHTRKMPKAKYMKLKNVIEGG